MRTNARLHADLARRHIGQPRFDLATRPLLTQHDCTAAIEADDVERVLPDIDTDHGNRSLCCRWHGVLLVWAPLASLRLLAGQEHGRTIPLSDLASHFDCPCWNDRPCANLMWWTVPAPDNELR